MSRFLWEITNSPYKSQCLSETRDFGQKPDVTLIDLYSGKQPSVIDNEFLSSGKRKFQIGASALLDSNLADDLVKLANSGNVSEGFLEFFRFLTENKWDFSLQFYYQEHFAKSGAPTPFSRMLRDARRHYSNYSPWTKSSG